MMLLLPQNCWRNCRVQFALSWATPTTMTRPFAKIVSIELLCWSPLVAANVFSLMAACLSAGFFTNCVLKPSSLSTTVQVRFRLAHADARQGLTTLSTLDFGCHFRLSACLPL